MNLIKQFLPFIGFIMLNFSALQSTQTVISPKLKQAFSTRTSANIIVTFNNRPTEVLKKFSQQTSSATDRGQKLQILSDELESLASSTQKNVLGMLEGHRKYLRFQSLWITNQLSIRGASSDLVNKLASMREVLSIEETPVFKFFRSEAPETSLHETNNTKKIARPGKVLVREDVMSKSIFDIQATKVWELGYTGKGVRVGIIDSGVRVSHDALYGSFVGTDEYGWFDPDHLSEIPSDVSGHGTACLGPMCGKMGTGVAPNAKWMACQCVDKREEYQVDWILHCFQFMLCPTDHKGNNKNCSRAPQVVSNSWNTIPYEPTDSLEVLREVLVLSGLHYTFCIGNYGDHCNTTGAPGNFKEFIGVGQTIGHKYYHMSSTGPDPTGKIVKPDIMAPVDTLTPDREADGFYSLGSGCSFSTPMVAGVIALMLQKNPNLTQDQVKTILFSTTDPGTVKNDEDVCGGIPHDQYPNNRLGWGIVNALKAVEKVPIP